MSVSKRLFSYLKYHRKRLAGGIFFTLLMGLNDSLLAPAAGIFLEGFSQIGTNLAESGRVYANFSRDFLWFPVNFEITNYNYALYCLFIFCGGLLILVIFKGFFVYVKEYLANSVTQKILMKLRNDLYSHAVYLPMRFFDRGKTGDLMSRITYDIGAIEQSFNSAIVVMQAMLYSVIFVTGMFVTDWQLSLFAIMIFPVFGVIIKFFATKIRKINRKIAAELAGITSFLQETISSVKIVKSYVREPFEEKRFGVKAQQYYNLAMKSVKLVAVQKPINEVLSMGGTFLLMLFLGYKLLNGDMTIGKLTTFMVFLSMAYKPLKTLGDANPVIQKALASAERIFEIIDINKEEDERRNDKMDLDGLKGKVEFENVSFYYNPGEPVLSDVTFTVESGRMIAFAGPSGAGKSTIINLVMGLYIPQKGDIKFDGKSISGIYMKSLRSYVSIVPQETLLFSGTIEENIRYGKLNATVEEITEAAKNANAHDFISGFPNGYQSEIGEKGTQLSGGQKQRIALARAFLKNPRILILDEATSALDSESERLVQDAAEKLMVGRTSFVIAHRLSTIRKADSIIVLGDGKIKQAGTHEELLEQAGIYKNLYDMQFNKEGAGESFKEN